MTIFRLIHILRVLHYLSFCKALVFTLVFSTQFIIPTTSIAQGTMMVEKIVILGNQRIETDTIRSYLLIQAGDKLDRRRIDQSLKSLFATGYFADLSIKIQGASILLNVKENPVINRIAFEGNLRIEDEVLKDEISLKPRVVFTRTKVQKDVKRLLEIYDRRHPQGRKAVTQGPTRGLRRAGTQD